MSERADIKTLVQIISEQSATISELKTAMDNLLSLTEEQSKKQTELLEKIVATLEDAQVMDTRTD